MRGSCDFSGGRGYGDKTGAGTGTKTSTTGTKTGTGAKTCDNTCSDADAQRQLHGEHGQHHCQKPGSSTGAKTRSGAAGGDKDHYASDLAG
jgi:hypothetical protein